MHLDTEGIVLRQVDATKGRRMILLFTKKYGKISCGTSLGTGKGKSSLPLRPFAQGNYHLFQARNYYNLDRAETIRSHYNLGEDIDKYMMASYVLELTEKVLPEELPQPAIYDLLSEFLEELSHRKKAYDTLLLAYETKLLKLIGSFPALDGCLLCGATDDLRYFSIREGGMICGECGEKKLNKGEDPLIFSMDFDIVSILTYFLTKPLSAFRAVSLEEETSHRLKHILREYISYHLDIGRLKSESVFTEDL